MHFVQIGTVVILGLYLFMLLRYGKRGWSSTPSDLPPREHNLLVGVLTAAWIAYMGGMFLHHPDRFPVLVLQILAVLVVAGAGVLFFRDRQNKPKVWRYAFGAGSVMVAVLGYMHLFRA